MKKFKTQVISPITEEQYREISPIIFDVGCVAGINLADIKRIKEEHDKLFRK